MTPTDAASDAAAADVMRLVREYRALPDGLVTHEAVQTAAKVYATLHAAVRTLAERAYPTKRRPDAWAALDANDEVRNTFLLRRTADLIAMDHDGWHVAPLVLAQLDEVQA